ncbi:FAD:protein FMN transferase [Shimia sp.]|uniref:FAD:protein FMN transferase n=1 Tax=Shimia sp. TaxID=1954381 RepID=UPI0035619D6B
MMLSRRRFLAISAAALATPAAAAPTRWQGRALGAEVGLTLYAPRPLAERALAQVRTRLRQIEALFSLYDPGSALTQLNRDGILPAPHPLFAGLMRLCDQAHLATKGVFDPSIQPLWLALATGGATEPARGSIGWQRVRRGDAIRLAPGQALTFNGIAQGFATDLIRADLARLGLGKALINIGEFAALGGPFRLGLGDPDHGIFATRRLHDGAIATSSPAAMLLGEQAHILYPDRAAQWSSVSVETPSAALADALSTAFALMSAEEIRQATGRLRQQVRSTLLAGNGDILTL